MSREVVIPVSRGRPPGGTTQEWLAERRAERDRRRRIAAECRVPHRRWRDWILVPMVAGTLPTTHRPGDPTY